MDDLSLHILDIAENSIRADANKIEIVVTRDDRQDLLRIHVLDDGKGMDADTLEKVRNPFFTSKHKKTGLGIPLLAQAAELAGGNLTLESTPGKGTRVEVRFQLDHIDRPALGSMAETVLTIIAGHPDLDIVYEERAGDRTFRFDTIEIRADLEGVPLNAPPVLEALRNMLKQNAIIQS